PARDPNKRQPERLARTHPKGCVWRAPKFGNPTHPTSFAMSAKGNIMNKLLKGSIAGAAGIALLLGGAGTLAYWNSSADLGGGTVNSGTLTIANNGAATVTGPTTIVPGDSVTVSQPV